VRQVFVIFFLDFLSWQLTPMTSDVVSIAHSHHITLFQ